MAPLTIAAGVPPAPMRGSWVRPRSMQEGDRDADGIMRAKGSSGAEVMDIQIADEWRGAYPGASVGVLVMEGVENPAEHPALGARASEVEDELRRRWGGATRAELTRLPDLEAYRRYYRRFGKTYHVQLQLESVALKGKPLRGPSALVLAMFVAELRNRLLTAGHDLGAVEGGVSVDVARGGERYVGIGGRELALESGDMYIRDGVGILSSVLHGPDARTRIVPETRRVLFCVYAMAGIGRAVVDRHLAEIAENVRLVAPGASTARREVYAAV